MNCSLLPHPSLQYGGLFFSPRLVIHTLMALDFQWAVRALFCAYSAMLLGFSALLCSLNNLCLLFLQRHLTVPGLHNFSCWYYHPAECGHSQNETRIAAKPLEYINMLSRAFFVAAQKHLCRWCMHSTGNSVFSVSEAQLAEH